MPNHPRRELPPELRARVCAQIKRIATINQELRSARAERDDVIAQLLEDGFTPGRIAREIGMSRQTVRDIELRRRLMRKSERGAESPSDG